MAGRLVEFFGYAPGDNAAIPFIEQKKCPFVDDKCIKRTPGGCTLRTVTSDPVIICPNRLYDGRHEILADIARTAFGEKAQLLKMNDIRAKKAELGLSGTEVAAFGRYWGSELKIPQPKDDDEEAGDSFYIDYVLVRLGSSGEPEDFTAVEVQTIDTTNSYKKQSEALLAGQSFDDEAGQPRWTSAGLNWANVSKRILPQLIYKGYVLRRERLCTKGMFFVCPAAVIRRIRRRLGTKLLQYPMAAGTITFVPYDIGPELPPGHRRKLLKRETFTTTVEQLAYAFVSPVNLPEMGVYEKSINDALIQRPKRTPLSP